MSGKIQSLRAFRRAYPQCHIVFGPRNMKKWWVVRFGIWGGDGGCIHSYATAFLSREASGWLSGGLLDIRFDAMRQTRDALNYSRSHYFLQPSENSRGFQEQPQRYHVFGRLFLRLQWKVEREWTCTLKEIVCCSTTLDLGCWQTWDAETSSLLILHFVG